MLRDILSKLVRNEIIEIEPQDNYLDLAFKFALRNKITVYDSLYIVQAMKKKAELLTSDEKQAKIAEKHGIGAILIL
jgi:predicted nucleic acid-binding protein